MNIQIQTNSPENLARVPQVLDFLVNSRLAPFGGRLWWSERVGKYDHASFSDGEGTPTSIDLEIAFLADDPKMPIRNIHHPRFIIGATGLPERINHLSLPFEGKRFNARWLWSLFELADQLGHKVRLLHCEHGFMAHEIVRLADWFHMDSVKEAVRCWLTAEMTKGVQDLIEAFPNTEIKTDVGRLGKLLGEEEETLILGSLNTGVHLPNRSHRLNYSRLLNRTGLSGYFLAEN